MLNKLIDILRFFSENDHHFIHNVLFSTLLALLIALWKTNTMIFFFLFTLEAAQYLTMNHRLCKAKG